MTNFQARFLGRLALCANGIESTTVLAWKLGTSRPAVVSAGRALERQGLVCSFRSDDSQWAALIWAVMRKPSNVLFRHLLEAHNLRRTRPRDAPDQEGGPVALRDEGTYRRRCGLGPGAHGGEHSGQRQRRDAGACVGARSGNRCLRRPGLPGRWQTGRDARDQRQLARGHAAGQAQGAGIKCITSRCGGCCADLP